MDFIDQLKQFSKRVESLKDSILTEEATKTSIIMPFFSLLGYDVFNPDEFVPEFTADVGIKKGEKVDYAIMSDGEPIILIEAKWIGASLQNHDSQLFRYFGTSKAKFAILTNGQYYRFYTDLDEPNKMDKQPFLEINILDIKEGLVSELKKFHKTNFNASEIFDIASDLKYSNEFKNIFDQQLSSPSDDFVKFFLGYVYSGRQTQSVIDRFRGVLKTSLNTYISEVMNEKIKSALNTASADEGSVETSTENSAESPAKPKKKIITTEQELEGYFIIKNLLSDLVDIQDIGYKDNEQYMSILYKNKVTNWIARLYLNSSSVQYLAIPDENKKENRIKINNVYDIKQYKEQLEEVLKRYIK